MQRLNGLSLFLAVFVPVLPSQAQWFELEDPDTGVICGLINAENVQMVINETTGGLILVNGNDRELVNTAIENGVVFIEGEQVGGIEFARDINDRRRVFWTTEIGSLYRLSTDGEPIATEIFPDEVVGECDPCNGLWDNEADCLLDPGLDGEVDTGTDLGTALLSGLCGAGASSGLVATMALSLLGFRLVRLRR